MERSIRFSRYRQLVSRFAAFALIALILVSTGRWAEPTVTDDVLFLVGILLIGFATVGRLWSALYISGFKNTELIRVGPYSMTRNPLYVCSLAGAVGVGLTSEMLTITALIVAGYALIYPITIRDEERRLLTLHGAAFEEYCRRVPRFFPAVRLLEEPDSYTVNTPAFRRRLLDSFWFVWAAGLLQLTEALHDVGFLPVLFRFY